MSSKLSMCTIFVALFWCASSIPVPNNSRDIECTVGKIFPSNSAEDFRKRNPAISAYRQSKELPGQRLSDLDEGVIATLSKLADLRLSNLAALQLQQQRSIPVLEKMQPVKFEEDPKDSLPMMNMESGGDTEVLKKAPLQVPERLESKPRKFHCHPIEDVFIAAVDKMVPAYICKLDLRQFILSSERFLQDYKYHLDVTVDESTFQHLVLPDDNGTGNSVANVIPVTLTQRQGDEFYGVKTA